MGVKININIPATMARFDPRYVRAQKFLDNEVLKDCSDYVPYRYGFLDSSGIRGTVIGSGKVVYNAPYARKCYYAGETVKFNTTYHKKATAQWFEKAKAVKCTSWKNGVNGILKGEI